MSDAAKLTTESRSGLSVTGPTGVQWQVSPHHEGPDRVLVQFVTIEPELKTADRDRTFCKRVMEIRFRL